MPSEDVIELSVEETNALRKKLGLAPLRMGNSNKRDDASAAKNQTGASSSSDAQVVELSVDETNDLREQLGLAPLRVTGADEEADGKSARQALHKPAENVGDKKQVAERMERSKLEREVQRKSKDVFSETTLGEEEEEGTSTLSWAAKMRAQKQSKKKESSKKKKGKTPPSRLEAAYDERDLEGIDVSHAASDFEAGSTTILTLADAPLLQTQGDHSSKAVGLNEDLQALQNVELAEQQVQREGLRQKRKVELGMGRAGGYAGFDDDEFEELGGTQGPSRLARGQQVGASEKDSVAQKTRGFKIGASVDEEGQDKDDLFAFQQGKAVSLDPAKADVTATDFMTAEEDDALYKKSKKRKKDGKFKKKKKKEKRHRRKEIDSDEEEAPSAGLLESLEQTAVGTVTTGRKRRRSDSEDETEKATMSTNASVVVAESVTASDADIEAKKRAKFDQIMAKGNVRTAAAFKTKSSSKASAPDMEEEPDDAFLTAAVAKARRLRRLKEMPNATGDTSERGAEAIVRAVKDSRSQQSEEGTSTGTMNFAVDETREFTRALRARAEQAERKEARKAQATSEEEDTKKVESEPTTVAEPATEMMETEEEPADMMELAKEMKAQDDDVQIGGFDGTTSNTVPVGRGLGNVLSMLRHTGEISGKNAGKEELRGRAKDERTYDDYEALDLSKVVKIGRGATEKDREFANREIKLEYRDEHGRLLTRKEAYRNLCYQFHGHGSSQKNEEKRLQQVARERAEARLASRQVADDSSGGRVGGTLGALKATQRATGKAFVVHKT